MRRAEWTAAEKTKVQRSQKTKFASGGRKFDFSCFVMMRADFSAWKLEAIEEARSSSFDYAMRVVRDETCANEPCSYFEQCRRSLKRAHMQPPRASRATNNFVLYAEPTIRSFTCECPALGFTSLFWGKLAIGCLEDAIFSDARRPRRLQSARQRVPLERVCRRQHVFAA